MELTVDVTLTKQQIEDYLTNNIGDMQGYDEFGKRLNIIRIACKNCTDEYSDIKKLEGLFADIIKEEKIRYNSNLQEV